MTPIWAAFALFSICMTPVSMMCQTTQTQDGIDSVSEGRILLLRNFYSGADLVYDQNGILLSGGIPGPWTLANVKITHVATTPQAIEIIGDRIGAWYRSGKISFVKIGKLKIHIARSGSDADRGTGPGTIFSKVFIQHAEDLVPMVPDYWKYYLQGSDSKTRRAAWRESLKNQSALALTRDARIGGVSAPKLSKSPDPKYSKEAESQHVEGTSGLVLVVDATGTVDNIAILEPLGLGLDEQAVLAVKHWRFQPAKKNGQPIRVEINIDLTFRCCP